jgi:WhiB family transcriptional regulator, redox-sensing transcriptional regulator
MPRSRREKPQPPRFGWQNRAACRGAPLELFFGPDGERSAERNRRESDALKLCAACPVQETCRRHAMVMPETHGVWGGTTEAERSIQRKAERRRRRETAA